MKDISRKGFWGLKNKLFPKKQPNIPAAKRNIKGQLITNYTELKQLYLDHFKFRLRDRPILPKFREFEKNTEAEFKNILLKTEKNKLKDWSEPELDKVLKCLKEKQSQDSSGWANELFCLRNIGQDLKSSVLLICNKVKNTQEIPNFFQDTYISAIPKKQKNPTNLDSLRGIFLINKVKSIFMRLLYNSNINNIEDNLTNSSIGGRKGKSARDHLFVLFSILTDIKQNNNSRCQDLVWYDLSCCFDGLWAAKTYLDLYNNGVQNNSLNLLHKINQKATISVKTPTGISKKVRSKIKLCKVKTFQVHYAQVL